MPPSYYPDSIQTDISTETYLENENAYWDSWAEIEIYFSEFPDSLYSSTRTDSLGFFRVKVPDKQECHMVITERYQWAYLHPTLVLKRILTEEDVQLNFLPILRNEFGFSEYVSRPVRRKFIFFGKWIYRIFHEPPPILSSFPDKVFRIEYEKRFINLNLQEKKAEIDFYEIMHGLATKDSLRMHYADDFPGRGDVDFHSFVNKRRNSPPEPTQDTVVHQVKIAFLVYKDGSLRYPIIRKSHDDWHDNEALRLFYVMPKFKPGRARSPKRGRRELKVLEFNFSYPR